jgi:tetratricopeptide (TPR) repeat protein
MTTEKELEELKAKLDKAREKYQKAQEANKRALDKVLNNAYKEYENAQLKYKNALRSKLSIKEYAKFLLQENGINRPTEKQIEEAIETMEWALEQDIAIEDLWNKRIV